MAPVYAVICREARKRAEHCGRLLQKINIYLSQWPSHENRDEVTLVIDLVVDAAGLSRSSRNQLFVEGQTQPKRIGKLFSLVQAQEVLLPGTNEKVINRLLNFPPELASLSSGIRSMIAEDEELRGVLTVEERERPGNDEADASAPTEVICKVCLVSRIEDVVTPCGHTLCHNCLERVDSCPFCRGSVAQTTRLHF